MAPRRPLIVEALRPVEVGYLSLRSLRIYSGLSVRTLRGLLKRLVRPTAVLQIGWQDSREADRVRCLDGATPGEYARADPRLRHCGRCDGRVPLMAVKLKFRLARGGCSLTTAISARRSASGARMRRRSSPRRSRNDWRAWTWASRSPRVRRRYARMQRPGSCQRADLEGQDLRFYRDNLENHIYPALGTVPLGSVCRRDVKHLLGVLAAKTEVGPRRSLALCDAQTVLSEAVEDEKLPANPALRPGRLRRRFQDPNAPKRQTIDRYTRAEAERLVETARTSARSGMPSSSVRSGPACDSASYVRSPGGTSTGAAGSSTWNGTSSKARLRRLRTATRAG